MFIKFLKLYITALGMFILLDMAWLGFVAKSFYQEHIGLLIKSNPTWFAVVLFYLIFIAGLVFFVLFPAIEKDISWVQVFFIGALFGFVTYATYDLTNLATLKNWSLLVTGVDLLWGAFICASVSAITYILTT